jgi:hypothetical protein
MKIACSSASFARALEEGRLTQLEWLDVCANELEVDGVVFERRHFPRTDADYVAQLRKTCADLGLTVAGLSDSSIFESGATDGRDVATSLDVANALGAPLVLAHASPASADPDAWGRFAEAAKAAARLAKGANVTLALRNRPGTLCESAADLKHVAKDVDSAWLRFAPEFDAPGIAGELTALLPKAVIAVYAIGDLATFATEHDDDALKAIDALQRFRGFILLERRVEAAAPEAYHAALERFAALRARKLTAPV